MAPDLDNITTEADLGLEPLDIALKEGITIFGRGSEQYLEENFRKSRFYNSWPVAQYRTIGPPEKEMSRLQGGVILCKGNVSYINLSKRPNSNHIDDKLVQTGVETGLPLNTILSLPGNIRYEHKCNSGTHYLKRL